jgi:hypothetical protein
VITKIFVTMQTSAPKCKPADKAATKKIRQLTGHTRLATSKSKEFTKSFALFEI